MEGLRVKVGKVYEGGLDVSPEDRGRILFEHLGIKFPKDEARYMEEKAGRILSDSGYYGSYPHVNSEAKPVLGKLKKKGIKIGLISNAARSSRTYRRMLTPMESRNTSTH